MRIHTEILNQDKAFKLIASQFAKYGLLKSIEKYNKGRHLLIDSKIGKFYCIYKRELFHSFKQNFPDFVFNDPLQLNTGDFKGESINLDSLDKAIEKNAILLFIHPDRKMFRIHPKLFKSFASEHSLIRKQDKVNIYKEGKENEITYSIPFVPSLFERFLIEDEVEV